MAPLEILQKHWGYSSFRPLQAEVIGSILQNKDTMALLPTGAGKSLCYQVPALARPGFALVISPLIALMKDQVARLDQLGIMSCCIHSGMNYHEVRTNIENMLHGPYKLLYVSPERLQTELFKEYLPSFDISLIAVDEAHCISQWGHDFRPDYLKIAELRATLPEVPILALTASATKTVQDDIAVQLQLQAPAIFRQSAKRKNIYYAVKYSENKPNDTKDNLSSTACNIVYCRSRKQTEILANKLIQQGIAATHYHAGMAKDIRENAQKSWMENSVTTMVATTAFGMGIDKPDVRTVLHYDAPEHLEGYYQEAGRAGRDGHSSKALLLYNATDISRLRESVMLQYPPESYLRSVYQAVNEYLQIPTGAQPDRYFPFDLADFCQKFDLEVTPASYGLKLLAQEGLWTITESVFHPAYIQFTTDRENLDQIVAAYPDLGYAITGILRLYGTVFHYPTTMRLTVLAKQLKMKKEMVEHLLQKLHRMEVLDYRKATEGPQLYFHHLRVDSRHLIIDMQRIALLRRQHEARTQAMINYLENEDMCRELMLRTYFGEYPDENCGHCDICLQTSATHSETNKLTKDLQELIKAEGSIQASLLIKKYPAAQKSEVLLALRKMADAGLLRIENNLISVVR
ncbi:MAG: RecQ family ATP-dependent DNA helicase [Bacteroidetes bacterium]|nr:RecQ family ATP-dependent DNA helicase [Bacteroidota bacterium]